MARKKFPSLTFEFSGSRVTAEEFVKGINAFFSLLNEVSANITGTPKGLRWIVRVEPGSVRMKFIPERLKPFPETPEEIVTKIDEGVRMIETRSERPTYFSDKALKRLRTLIQIRKGESGKVQPIKVGSNGKRSRLTQKSLANINRLFEGEYKDWGSIEGKLEMIAERPSYRFAVYDDLTDKPINCHFPKDILPEILKAFGKRVYVSGIIHYQGDGEPLSIDVEEIELFPSPQELPSASDVEGILRNND
ncbi:MAG: hypothetical protein C4532_07485 [Candidatus Abyssobacteria bacterium SURF_17]|uniref:Uncharacterized protein n=1 Tax=Candidatus Abyssobacteria bacterium SURF_17 TaxID=2093361 RepID=A0A419F0E3_9BACT|nr:MAG: hypothetical protein C4532_07485 [Candidatus Abyssubacteria bacterium SURF_17]